MAQNILMNKNARDFLKPTRLLDWPNQVIQKHCSMESLQCCILYTVGLSILWLYNLTCQKILLVKGEWEKFMHCNFITNNFTIRMLLHKFVTYLLAYLKGSKSRHSDKRCMKDVH